MNIICFHNPDEENEYLSNWYLSDFIVSGINYSSMEQYMMYQKAILFHDESIAKQILNTNNVAYIKSLGRKVSNYNDHYWNGIRQVVVYKGLMEKFKQNDNLRKELLNTGDAVLAECAVKDKIWGIGLSMSDSNRYDKTKWKGQNLLGYSLMAIRNELK